MDPTIEELRAQQEELVTESQTIMAAADAEKRDLKPEEVESINHNSTEFDRIKGLIATREAVMAQHEHLSRPMGRRTAPDDMVESEEAPEEEKPLAQAAKPRQERARATVVGDRSRLSRSHGFRGFGDYLSAVRSAGTRGGETDGRLLAALSTFGNEGSGADGGFAVPPEYRETIMERVFGEDSLIARTDLQTVGGNQLTYPISLSTPWDNRGVQAFWTNEAAKIQQSKPQLEEVSVRLHKLSMLVPMTEELLEDSTAMASYVQRHAAQTIDYKVSTAIAFGTGAGQPLGFMNSPVLVTQAAESGQAPDTVVVQNIVNMYSRMPANSRATAAWIIHPDVEPQLNLMTLGDQPIYIPPGGLSASPYGLLMGRPVIPHQVAQELGNLGDVMFVDLSQYLAAVKAGGLRSQTSIHFFFDQDATAFKFTMRVAGQPWWSEAIQDANGTGSRSPFVTLAAR